MPSSLMRLKVLLPSGVFTDNASVASIVAHTPHGFMGFLPQRLDCVAALAPGILSFVTESDGEHYLALDEGVLVKTGNEVFVSVRNAIGGTDLGSLHEAVKREFMVLGAQEKNVRLAMTKLESGFIRRFAAFHHVQ